MYVAGCNRVGDDPNGLSYSGDSNHQPSGRDPGECGARRATRLDAELSLETLQSYRSAFPARRDADSFLRLD